MNTEVNTPWHSKSASDAVSSLRSNIAAGLSSAEVTRRLAEYGTNTLPEPKKRSLFSIFAHQFLSPLIYLLLGAAGIALFIGEARDAVVIFVVVFTNAVIGAYQEGRAENSLRALRRLSKLNARVIRDGHEHLVEASEIVPGDILVLNSGDAVPADARLIEASMISVAEAALTGESLSVIKTIGVVDKNTLLVDRHNMIYAGTHITSGQGLAIVTATGVNNEIGKIAHLTTTTVEPKTQLEVRIQKFGKVLVVASFLMFLLVITIGLWRGISFIEIFMIAISQMVSLVPEGLPVAMTIALAVGVQRMARRELLSDGCTVETLGSTTVICSDKTGTLTRNEMAVTTVLPALW
ncbi:MAG: HAD-IC family P-type ATPase [Bdellovibrionales bacterium]